MCNNKSLFKIKDIEDQKLLVIVQLFTEITVTAEFD